MFLSSTTTRRLLVPSIHHTVPLPILALVHNLTRIHRPKQHTPLATVGITATYPLVRFVRIHRSRHGRGTFLRTPLTILECLVAVQSTYPNSQVLPRALVHGTFGRGGGLVLLLGRRTPSTVRIGLVHGTIPSGGELACVDDST